MRYLLNCLLFCLVTACSRSTNLAISIISEQIEMNKLSQLERCERIHVDLRKKCREDYKKELESLDKAINKNK